MLEEKIRKYITDKNIIHPHEVSEKFHISIKEAYEMLERFADEGLLTSVLEPFCERCHSFAGVYYYTFMDLPAELTCPFCGYTITNLLEDAIVVYKKTTPISICRKS